MKKYKSAIKKLGLFWIAATLLFSGCSKSLEENPSSFVGPVNYYNNPDQVLSGIAASLSILWSSWVGWSYGWQPFRNDDQFAGGDLVITPDFATEQWNFTYKSIMNLNAAIGAMKAGKLKGTPDDQVNQLMGQAKFVRAFNYFMLVRMFGGVPLITEETEDPAKAATITRSSIESVYDLIISDYTAAIASLPASWPTAQQGRPTRDAAKGLLAKVYLTMATYPLNETQYYRKAADLAKEVMDAGVYSLVKDVDKVFGYDTKYGPEMMWSFNSNTLRQTTSPQIWSTINGWGDFQVDPRFVLGDSAANYPAYPDQPRRNAYIQLYPRNTTDTAGKYFTQLGQAPGEGKFMYDPQANWDAVVSTINMPIIRYADVLLIFAEAENMASGGPTQAAVDAINKVIDRANGYVVNANDPLATLAMSKDEFDAKVIQERSWELCFEVGDRWFDIVRKRILEQVTRSQYLRNYNPEDYLFPIPSNDVRLNPLLDQNPGYK